MLFCLPALHMRVFDQSTVRACKKTVASMRRALIHGLAIPQGNQAACPPRTTQRARQATRFLLLPQRDSNAKEIHKWKIQGNECGFESLRPRAQTTARSAIV